MNTLRPAMRVRDLLAGISQPAAAGDIVVHGLTLDSRALNPGDAFIALQGSAQHGISFAPAALACGASIVLAEAPAPAVFSTLEPVVWITELREHLGMIAARYFGEPSRAMNVIGVTGTNGKTSTVQLLAQALNKAGRKVATIGTLGAGLYGAIEVGERTTPDAIRVQALLAQFRDAGASDVMMEVSSHALDQGRVNGVAFDVAIFTNLTRDHLDYHGDMAAYGASKAKLFAWPELACAVINADDAFGRDLLTQLPPAVKGLSYGLENMDSDIVVREVHSSAVGMDFHLTTPWGEGAVCTQLLGRFNVSNLMAVAGCLGGLGFTFVQIQDAISQLEPVMGRMNRLGGIAAAPLVVIDYAHTPDALQQALMSLRDHTAGRLICVFGCGGERDPGKRSQMGAIAERWSDVVLVTDDNPRNENGDAIIAQILTGFERPQLVRVERNRAVAIASAIHTACAGDVVLIAGKGHERYQEIAGRRLPFDDLYQARSALETRAC